VKVHSTYYRFDWRVLYWRQAPCDLLPAGDFKNLSVGNKYLPKFPTFFNLLVLVDIAMDPSAPLQSFASLKGVPGASTSRGLRLFFALSAAMTFVVIRVVMGTDWLFLEVCCTRVVSFSDG
jgi:hypothetical protein